MNKVKRFDTLTPTLSLRERGCAFYSRDVMIRINVKMPMKIAIYANEIAEPGRSGVKTYSLEIIKELLKLDSADEYIIYSKRDISSLLGDERARLVTEGPDMPYWAFSVFPRLVRRNKPDAVFLPIQIFPFFIRRKHKPKVVVTIHDTAFLLFPDQFTFLKRELLKFHTRRAAKLSDAIIVPSEATKRDVIKFYGVNAEKIAVIPHGVTSRTASGVAGFSLRAVWQRGSSVIPAEAGIQGEEYAQAEACYSKDRYVLFVGTIQPRKNIVRLAEAFARVKETQQFADLRLVICGGKGWMYDEIFAELDRNPYKSDIILTGSVDDDVLVSLYKNAELFIMPSLYEGFGLPVLEAMSYGLPVIASDNSSLSEIVGDAGLLVDAKSVEDIASKLKMLLTSQTLKAELSKRSLERVKAFSWEKAARETKDVILKEVKDPVLMSQ